MNDWSKEQGDLLESARRIVETHVHRAQGAILAGSVLTSRRTKTSDLDIIVFVANGEESFRETVQKLGWLAELFVQTPSSFDFFVAQETAARRSTLLSMCAEGAPLFSVDGTTERYQVESRRLLELGPPPLTKSELNQARYQLTDLLDDFASVSDGMELIFITSQILKMTTELALSSDGQWLGTGKWLARRLQEWNPDLSARLSDGVFAALTVDDREELRSITLNVLTGVGGPLSNGYRQSSTEV
ncbi:MAG TPA: nucleotidyltransferase domain-containing protein [Acidimicrobiales bacterium]|nr:nucleotidyltransferase domain-containing protein [Acidimicrobiales bacterium]